MHFVNKNINKLNYKSYLLIAINQFFRPWKTNLVNIRIDDKQCSEEIKFPVRNANELIPPELSEGSSNWVLTELDSAQRPDLARPRMAGLGTVRFGLHYGHLLFNFINYFISTSKNLLIIATEILTAGKFGIWGVISLMCSVTMQMWRNTASTLLHLFLIVKH